MRVIIMVLLLVLSSANSLASEVYSPYGRWIRDTDLDGYNPSSFKGNMIEVGNVNGQVCGMLISISELTESYGYSLGDLKWTNLKRVSNVGFIFKGLLKVKGKSKQYDTSIYLNCSFKMITQDIVIIRVIKSDIDFTGKNQKWVRVPFV